MSLDEGAIELSASPHQYKARDLLEAIRPKQWIKNLVVPMVGIAMLGDKYGWWQAAANLALGFAAFCMAASSIYVLNDLVDIKADRAHPKKRHRPIASGRVCTSFLCGLLAVACPLSLFLAYIAHPQIMVLLLIYFVINIAYCFKLKHVAQVDMVCVASGFTLRALAGAFAVGAVVDFWILAAITFSCVGLAIMKRMKELKALGSSGETRPVLAKYDYHTLLRAHDIFMVLATQSLVMFLEHSSAKFDNSLKVAVVLTLISAGFLVFMHQVHGEQDGDPTALIYRNKFMVMLMTMGFAALFLFE